ncbi:MAG: hypothetical protein ACRD21_24380, partial [Vicinamibacteria bacterium]
MPTRELLLCRGYRGLASCVVRRLRELRDRDPAALASTLVIVPTAAATHLFRRPMEDALLDRRASTVLPKVSTSAELLPLLSKRIGLRLVDPLLREALLERGFEKAREEGATPPFVVRSGLAPRVLDLFDELFAR